MRHGLQLSYATLAYNCLEGIIAIVAGLAAGSIALVGFGADSLIEVTASVTAIWRLRSDFDPNLRDRSERISLRIILSSRSPFISKCSQPTGGLDPAAAPQEVDRRNHH